MDKEQIDAILKSIEARNEAIKKKTDIQQSTFEAILKRIERLPPLPNVGPPSQDAHIGKRDEITNVLQQPMDSIDNSVKKMDIVNVPKFTTFDSSFKTEVEKPSSNIIAGVILNDILSCQMELHTAASHSMVSYTVFRQLVYKCQDEGIPPPILEKDTVNLRQADGTNSNMVIGYTYLRIKRADRPDRFDQFKVLVVQGPNGLLGRTVIEHLWSEAYDSLANSAQESINALCNKNVGQADIAPPPPTGDNMASMQTPAAAPPDPPMSHVMGDVTAATAPKILLASTQQPPTKPDNSKCKLTTPTDTIKQDVGEVQSQDICKQMFPDPDDSTLGLFKFKGVTAETEADLYTLRAKHSANDDVTKAEICPPPPANRKLKHIAPEYAPVANEPVSDVSMHQREPSSMLASTNLSASVQNNEPVSVHLRALNALEEEIAPGYETSVNGTVSDEPKHLSEPTTEIASNVITIICAPEAHPSAPVAVVVKHDYSAPVKLYSQAQNGIAPDVISTVITTICAPEVHLSTAVVDVESVIAQNTTTTIASDVDPAIVPESATANAPEIASAPGMEDTPGSATANEPDIASAPGMEDTPGSTTTNAPEIASAPGMEAAPGYETALDDAPASKIDMESSSTMVLDAAPSGVPVSEVHLLDAPEESHGANVPYDPTLEVQVIRKALIAASEMDAASVYAPAPEKDVSFAPASGKEGCAVYHMFADSNGVEDPHICTYEFKDSVERLICLMIYYTHYGHMLWEYRRDKWMEFSLHWKGNQMFGSVQLNNYGLLQCTV